MFDTVLGLPVHALVVHAVVVLVPLAALGTLAIAIVPRWRQRYGMLVLLVATAGLALVPVATNSGQRLRDRIDAGGVVARQIQEHADLGNQVVWVVLAGWVLIAAFVLAARRGRRDRTVTLLAVLAAIGMLAAGGAIARVGHLGSTAVWSCTIGSDACR